MTEEDIQKLLENLGTKISMLAEENRICKNRDNAGRKLISLLENYLTENEWEDLYHSVDDPFIKKLMIDWGLNLFPKDFEK